METSIFRRIYPVAKRSRQLEQRSIEAYCLALTTVYSFGQISAEANLPSALDRLVGGPG